MICLVSVPKSCLRLAFVSGQVYFCFLMSEPNLHGESSAGEGFLDKSHIMELAASDMSKAEMEDVLLDPKKRTDFIEKNKMTDEERREWNKGSPAGAGGPPAGSESPKGEAPRQDSGENENSGNSSGTGNSGKSNGEKEVGR